MAVSVGLNGPHSDPESDVDSETGGISSGEEFALDLSLRGGSKARESDPESDVDSETGGISSGEEFALDLSLRGESKSSPVASEYSPDEESSGEDSDTEVLWQPSPSKRARGGGRIAPLPQTPPSQPIPAAKGYDNADTPNQLPPFAPTRPTGLHLELPLLRGAMTRAIDFFRLFFTDQLVGEVCVHTNAYAWANIENKSSYGDGHGSWIETTPEEIKKLIALILYCGLVNVTTFHRYWSTKTLYHGLWARSIMSRERFKALMAMLHVVDPAGEDDQDRLRKVSSFLDHFKNKCKSLYQPFQQVAVDERMVKSKHRSGIRQNMKNKPTKYGVKLWILADSANGYTCDFDVYIGKKAGQEPSENGLGYDVVMKLATPLLNQGYHLYFDNFYTSEKLVKDLFEKRTPATGTAAENRKGFPASMKNGKKWSRKLERGSMRWERDGVCLAQQWKDNRTVTILSSIECANDYLIVSRKQKVANRWSNIDVKQPKAINNYNQYMNGVDRSDQLISKNNVLKKCMRWWKVLFFHMIDIAIVNSFILFQLHRAKHPEDDALKRPKKFSIAEYREELVRQLVGLEEYGQPPVHNPPTKKPGQFNTEHIPKFSGTKRNCKVCYAAKKKEMKVRSYCDAPQCQVYLHCTQEKNCFETWHSDGYQH